MLAVLAAAELLGMSLWFAASAVAPQLAAGWQIGNKTFLVLNAGFCRTQQVSVANTLGASLQYRVSPEWRTEASFEPVGTYRAIGGKFGAPRDVTWVQRPLGEPVAPGEDPPEPA